MKAKIYTLILICILSSCKKDWLEKKRDISVIVPTSLREMRLLLNNDLPLNSDTRGLVESSPDDIYFTVDQFNNLLVPERNAMLWKKDLYEGTMNIKDWDVAYQSVLYCNVILEGLDKIERTPSNAREYDTIKGNALFFRSRAFLNLAMTFCTSYNPSTATTDLGIPLKLTSDITEKVSRASLQQVYEKITIDLKSATDLLLPTTTIRTDGSKVAAYGLLARCYLYMGKYALALEAANESYKIKNSLIDFNSLNPAAARPIAAQSVEVHCYTNIEGITNNAMGYSNIDENLFNSYADNDLRKTIFFQKRADGGIHFRGSYNGNTSPYCATATDEILLIRAECKARLNDIPGALNDINTLLVKRYKVGTFVPLGATDQDAALQIIRQERRKELLRRGLRWEDLKRYNRDPKLAVTLTKTFNGLTYSIPPNDARYVMPIPENVIKLNGIQQNPR